jgi:hypothetical protein
MSAPVNDAPTDAGRTAARSTTAGTVVGDQVARVQKIEA